MRRTKRKPVKKTKGRKKPPGLLKRVARFGLKVGAGITLAAIGLGVLYGYAMSSAVEKRFNGRRWSVPSRAYSDNLLMFPGQGLPQGELRARLHRLGYRKVGGEPAKQGQFREMGNSLTVHFRSIDLPVLQRDATRVRFEFAGKRADAIEAMTDPTTGQPVPVFELEPEEMIQVFGEQHESRQLLSIKQVPDSLIGAVLSAEDADFYRHFGVDLVAIARALYVNIRAGKVRQGGSTLTQQLAKTFFLTPERTVLRKVQELIIALVIEAKYDKDTILEIYLNEVYLGQRGSVSVHGFGEAARFYFGKPVEQLTVAESATLAGIIRSPNRYSPYKNPEVARERRNQVLIAMKTNGVLGDGTAAEALDSDLQTVPFKPYRRKAPYFFDYVASQLSTMYPDTDLSRVGLSLYTTLDVGVQAQAERALAEGLAALEEKKPKLRRDKPGARLQGAVIVLEPNTGHVLAMVGGRDYNESQFNRATQAKRQPGSAFKPFVYHTALDRFSLTDRLSNERKTYRVANRKRWRPKNYDGKHGGTVTLRQALTHSMNVPTVDLAEKIGLEPIIETARDFGITTKLEPRLSLSLGAFEVEPMELALAYSVFANDGVLPHALSLRSVVDDKGRVLKRQHLKIQTVTTSARAFMMSSALKGVVDHGTARGLRGRGIDFPVAGKTGTTNDYRDAWFVGYTPELVTLVWVGFDDGTSLRLAASRVALPIWADLMRSIDWRISRRWFAAPGGVVQARVCAETGLLAAGGCPHVIEEVFEPSRVPTEECRAHRSSLSRFLDSIGL